MIISISVVIYDYRQKDFHDLISSLMLSIEYLLDKQYVETNLIIVNNNESICSESEIIETLKTLCYKYDYKYIKSKENKGYGHANNIAIREVRESSDFHIVCNPDIVFFDDTLFQAISFMTNQDNYSVGLLTPAIYDESNILHYLCKRNPTFMRVFARRFPLPFIKKFLDKKAQEYNYTDKNYQQKIENVEFCSGCFMFFRTNVLSKLDSFDERYFMYFEDADITRRVLNKGYRIVYNPRFRVIHKWERASMKSLKFTLIAIHSAFRYFWKWK